MSDPLPAQVFNLMYDARPDDIGARYAAGIEQAGVYGSSRGEATAADAGAPPREPHHLLPTPDPIDASVVKAILEFRSSLQHLSIRATETLGAISRRTWGMREKAGRRALGPAEYH